MSKIMYVAEYWGLLWIVALSVLSCRGNNDIQELSLMGVDVKEISLDTAVISELIVPSGIATVGANVVIVNGSKTDNVLYCYDSCLHFTGSYKFYGNGPDEFNFVSGQLKVCDGESLSLYTDYFFATEFRFSGDSVYVAREYRVSDDLLNNVIVMNDSLVFYRALQSKHPFGIYNMNSTKHERGFGDFPQSSIMFKTAADKDNICLSNSVYDGRGDILYVFYESLPLVRLYNMSNYRMLKEIHISDAKKQIRSLDEYYEDKGIIYFLRPVFSGENIYVTFVNDSPDMGMPDNMEIVRFDLDGNISSCYKLNRFCPIYTVSDSGVLYGISVEGDDYILCKADLKG